MIFAHISIELQALEIYI